MAETHQALVALAAAGAAVGGTARVGGEVAGDEDAVEAFLHRHVGCVARHRGFGKAAEEAGGGGGVLRLGRSAGAEGGEGVLEGFGGRGCGGGMEVAGGIMLLGRWSWRDGCWWVDIGDAGVEVGGPLRWIARYCWG